jgi:hypothetical protein
MKRNSQPQKIDFTFESIIFYPIEIPVFYKAIKSTQSMCLKNDNTDLKNYLTYLEPKFKVLLQNIYKGNISPINMVFHIYEISYICTLIDTYLIDGNLVLEKEKYLYEILERFEYLYYKHFSKIKHFNLYPITKKEYLLKEIQKEKENFFKTQQ